MKRALCFLSFLCFLNGAVFAADQQAAVADPFAENVAKLKSKDINEKRRAVEALGSLRDARAIDYLKAMLKDSDAFVRSAALEALGLMRAGQVIDDIISVLAKDASDNVRQSAAVALNYIGDRKAVPALISALKDKSDGVRFAAVNALGSLRDISALPALTEGLKDVNLGMRRACLFSIGRFEDVSTLPAIREAVKDADVNIRAEAIRILGQMKDKESIASIKIYLSDADAKVKICAAGALAQMGLKDGTDVALSIFKNEKDSGLRSYAASVLGYIGGSSAKAALEKGVNDADPSVKQSSESALLMIKSTAKPQVQQNKPKPAAATPAKKVIK